MLGGDHPENKLARGYCACPAGDRERVRDAQMASAIAWSRSGIPHRFREFSLDTSPLAVTKPSLIEEMRSSGSSWFLWGPVGTGKTGLAVGYARAWVFDSGCASLAFRPIPDLLSDLRDTYNRRDGSKSESDVLRECREAELLVLDDIGAEHVKDSGWLEDRLYQIIGHRHGDDSATVFTSNLSLPQLAARIGERNTWRIAEMCEGRIVRLDGANLRLPKEAGL